MAKYYKKVTIEKDWIQPVLTSNGTLGGNSFAVGGVSNRESTSNFYKMFDKKTDDYVQFFDNTDNYITFYNPDRLKISSFTISYYSGTHMSATLYGSNDNKNWTKIVDFNHTNNTQQTTISNPVGYLYHKIANIDGHGNNGSGSLIIADICEITINATYEHTVWQPCTKEEYDNLPADQRKIITDVYSIFSRNKYYKKTSTILPWTQPIITEDGILGGNTFAVGVAPNYNEYKKIYLSFQKDLPANGGGAIAGAGSYRAYIMYNPAPIKITNLHIKNVNGQQPKGGTVYGSNDGATWIKIKDYTNTQLASRGEWNLDLSDNNKFYHYYKVDNGTYVISGNSEYAWYLGEITITATQQASSWAECTKEEYDNSLGYYKKIETPFNQPVLTSDGTLGGSSFAVSTTGGVYSSGHELYRGFDNNTATSYIATAGAKPIITMYNPIPLNITKFQVTNRTEGTANVEIKQYKINVSNDGLTYTNIYSGTNSISAMGGIWNIDLSANNGYFKYYQIEVLSIGSVNYCEFAEIQITATEQTWQQCTKQEYDLLPDSDRMLDSSNRKIENSYYASAITSLKNMSIIKEPVTDYVSVSEGVASATGVQKLTDAQALSIINGEYVWTRIYNNNIGIATYTFKDNIALSSFSFTTGWNGDGLAYPSSLKWEALVNGSWVSVYSATASEGGWGGNRANRTINVNSNVFSNTYRFSIGGYNITLGGIPYYDWLQDLKLNVIKKIVIDESKSVFIDSNIQTVGTLAIDNNGIASGFSNANYCQLPAHLAPSSNWEVNMCVQPHSTATLSTSVNWWESHAMILGIPNGHYGWWDHGTTIIYTKQPNITMMCTTNSIQIILNSSTYGGDSTGIGTIIKTGLTLSSAKFYDIKINFTGTSYIAQYREYGTNNWITLGNINSSTKIGECQLLVGHSYQGIAGDGWIGVREDYFNGKIDLFNSYIKVNNQLWWTNKQISKSGLIITNHLAGVNSEMKEVVVEKAWTQPILTSNGTLGGDSFAVYTTSTATDMPQNLYKAFNSTDNPAGVTYARINTNDVIFYSPNPLKCNQFSIMDYWSGSYYQYGLRAGIVKGSNNGTDWVTIDTISGGTAQKKNVFNFTNNNFYKYYKLTPTDVAPEGWYCQSFRITNNPTQQVSQWQP